MQINLESIDKHSIQGYDDHEVRINNVLYSDNILVCAQELIHPWKVSALSELKAADLEFPCGYQPKIIIIGHNQTGKLPPFELLQALSKRGIGLEAMSIGAACRTFNVLLSEQRDVIFGVMF